MIQRRARAAGFKTKIGNHTFRATGITTYLKNSGKLEHAQAMANHSSTRTTELYDRRDEEISLMRSSGSRSDGADLYARECILSYPKASPRNPPVFAGRLHTLSASKGRELESLVRTVQSTDRRLKIARMPWWSYRLICSHLRQRQDRPRLPRHSGAGPSVSATRSGAWENAPTAFNCWLFAKVSATSSAVTIMLSTPILYTWWHPPHTNFKDFLNGHIMASFQVLRVTTAMATGDCCSISWELLFIRGRRACAATPPQRYGSMRPPFAKASIRQPSPWH